MITIVGDCKFRSFGRRGPPTRIILPEPSTFLRPLPDRLIETAIYLNALFRSQLKGGNAGLLLSLQTDQRC